jgi:hypothetical protein
VSAAGEVVALARERFWPVLGVDGRAYAVPDGGPAVAYELHPQARGGLRAQLARMWFDERGRVAGGGALGAAVATLALEAERGVPVPVAYRVARLGDGRAVVDLGRPDGCCVMVGPGGWWVADRSPVLFRRSALTGELPVPVAGGDVAELADLVGPADIGTWTAVLRWLVAALFADAGHPVLALTGGAGVGKSTVARLLVSLVDPSPVPLRQAPRDLRSWLTTARASWVIGLDDVAPLRPWLAELLAHAVDGSPMVCRRAGGVDVDVVELARPVLITGRGLGPAAHVLGDRLVTVTLGPIPARRRRAEADLWGEFTAGHSRHLGALLDVAGRALLALGEGGLS